MRQDKFMHNFEQLIKDPNFGIRSNPLYCLLLHHNCYVDFWFTMWLILDELICVLKYTLKSFKIQIKWWKSKQNKDLQCIRCVCGQNQSFIALIAEKSLLKLEFFILPFHFKCPWYQLINIKYKIVDTVFSTHLKIINFLTLSF